MSNLEINSSPTKLSSGNKRLTKVPIFIFIGIILVVLFAIFYAAMNRNNTTKDETTKELAQQGNNASNINTDDFLSSLEKNSRRMQAQKKIEEIKKEEAKKLILPPIQPIQQTPPMMVQTPMPPNPKPKVRDEVTQQALISKSKLGMSSEKGKNQMGGGGSGNLMNAGNPLAMLTGSSGVNPADAVSMLGGAFGGNSNGGSGGMGSNSSGGKSMGTKGTMGNNINSSPMSNTDDMSEEEKLEYIKKMTNPTYLHQNKEKQISKYELKPGWLIPAVLLTGLNSELRGDMIAQVSQNVYDTATGRHLLIPQGTKIVGTYNSDVVYAQERIITAWNQLVFPDGSTLALSDNNLGMNGIDQSGYSGFQDQVNNHYLRIFGSAILLSSIPISIALADQNSDNRRYETNSSRALSQAIDELSGVTRDILRKNMNIAPTIEIRPGYKFNIFVNKSVILEPLPLEATR